MTPIKEKTGNVGKAYITESRIGTKKNRCNERMGGGRTHNGCGMCYLQCVIYSKLCSGTGIGTPEAFSGSVRPEGCRTEAKDSNEKGEPVMTEREKAQARWKALQEEDRKNNYFLEFILFIIVLSVIYR